MHGHDHGWEEHRRRHGGPGAFGFGPFAQAFGGGGGGMGFGRPGRGPRARRGDVRLAVLILLAEQPRHGYEIIQELVERSQGAWQPSPGSVYPTLQLLEEEGFLHGTDDNGKRRFEITEEGLAHLAANRRESAPWDDMARSVDPAGVELGRALKHVAMATAQVGEVGTEDQQRSAVKLLAETRRQLYVLLADEGAPASEPAAAGATATADAGSEPPAG